MFGKVKTLHTTSLLYFRDALTNNIPICKLKARTTKNEVYVATYFLVRLILFHKTAYLCCMKEKDLSKFLSLILRHQPDVIGITLDAQGWVDIDILLDALHKDGKAINRTILDKVVAENNKKRFAFDETGTRIRANQGHSIEVDLALPASEPPAILYHGTAEKTLVAIRQEGLTKQARQHVHLSTNTDTAMQVGGRHGKPCVLKIQAGKMQAAGYLFYIADNGVWLTDYVPVAFIDF